MIAFGSAGDIARQQVADLMKGTPMSDIVEMLRTPTGCMPPSKWEVAAADEIVRLRNALQDILTANISFRASMPDDWEGDLLQGACDAARLVLNSAVGSPSSQKNR